MGRAVEASRWDALSGCDPELMSATVTAIVRLLMGCLVMAFLTVWLASCARPPERNIWREMMEAGEL